MPKSPLDVLARLQSEGIIDSTQQNALTEAISQGGDPGVPERLDIPREKTLEMIHRGTEVVGKLLDGLSVNNPPLKTPSRTLVIGSRVLWAAVEVVTARSMVGMVLSNLLGLGVLFSIVLIIMGTAFPSADSGHMVRVGGILLGSLMAFGILAAFLHSWIVSSRTFSLKPSLGGFRGFLALFLLFGVVLVVESSKIDWLGPTGKSRVASLYEASSLLYWKSHPYRTALLASMIATLGTLAFLGLRWLNSHYAKWENAYLAQRKRDGRMRIFAFSLGFNRLKTILLGTIAFLVVSLSFLALHDSIWGAEEKPRDVAAIPRKMGRSFVNLFLGNHPPSPKAEP
ncbi:hypothetical protein EON79_07385 [bacterium]|nr:MAG: hypothetical protein EON79_07385 [bacterium]